MPARIAPVNTHPPVGTIIDNGALELVEVLGVGGYGVVYRAVPTGGVRHHPDAQSYAVKCLWHGDHPQSSRKRQLHLREIMLHRLASAHPNVITLHRIIDDDRYTYLVLDFATSHDLFTQILHGGQYLGNDDLIRHVFLQLLDAVEYCHSMGIYHRDLKPENILCFDNGLRVAITDFGLATTDKFSTEYRTGSVYHMSPECQAGTASYSPPANDIWSLGIILINLITGRNPFRSSALDDPTFQCYLQNPSGFLPTVLPLSHEVNRLLCGMMAIDWRHRIPLSRIRQAIENIETFYAPGVIFEGSMARCAWEAPMEVDDEDTPEESSQEEEDPVSVDSVVVKIVSPETGESQSPVPFIPDKALLQSHWSQDSSSEEFRGAKRSTSSCSQDQGEWQPRRSWSPTCVNDSSSSMDSKHSGDSRERRARAPSPSRTPSDSPPWPHTPEARMSIIDTAAQVSTPRQRLTVDTNFTAQRRSYSESSSMMFTAVDDTIFDSFFLPSAKSNRMSGIEVVDRSTYDAEDEDNDDQEMLSPSMWKSYDRPSAAPVSPLLYSTCSTSATTLSSFRAARTPSSTLTLSSQDSFYLSDLAGRQKRQNLLPSSQPVPLLSHGTITNDSSSSSSSSSSDDTAFSCFEALSISNGPSTSATTATTHQQWENTCSPNLSTPFFQAPTSKFNTFCNRGVTAQEGFSTGSDHSFTGFSPLSTASGHDDLRYSVAATQEAEPKAAPSSRSAPNPAAGHGTIRRTPFRWITEFRTNIFSSS